MELFNTILWHINNVLMGIAGIAFTTQIIYIILSFFPSKKIKKSKVKHKFGLVIPARNEEAVITKTIECLKKQNYAKDKFDIFIIAHNCTDKTAEVARNAGAIVFEYNDEEPSHKRASYALKAGFENILKDYDNYDAFIRFDADNFVHPDYINKMNDAYSAGYKLARGYNSSKNFTQNVYSGISGLWYLRDCRFSARGRKLINCSQFLVGSGMMISAEIIKKDNGWTKAMGICEDQEFAIKQLYAGYKSTYVEDAIVYEDQPSTFKDSFNRNVRIGNGTIRLFFTEGFKCLGKFFKTFEYSYLDIFLTLLFIPIAVVFCTWIPLYYGYLFFYYLGVGNWAMLTQFGINCGYALGLGFVVPFILQALLVTICERKRLGKENCSKLWLSILCFPLFMIIYAAGICWGAFTKANWKQIKRNDKLIVDTEMLAIDEAEIINEESENNTEINNPESSDEVEIKVENVN